MALSVPSHAPVVGPLARGLTLLRTMGAPGHHRMSPGALAKATGLARSTVDRLISTLVHTDCLRFDGREAELAPRLTELGNAYLTSVQLPRVLSPCVTALADELDESVSVAVPDGAGVRTIAQATRRRPMSLAFRIGDPLPSERSAPATLLHPAAGSGPTDWAVDDQSIEPGLIAVAVLVRAPGGEPACAVSVVSHTSRHTVDSLRDHVLPQLRESAAQMERAYAARLTALRSHSEPERHSQVGDPIDRPAPIDRTTLTDRPTLTDDPAPADHPEPTLQPRGRHRPSTAVATTLRASKEAMGAEFLQSLARGLAVLTAFDADHDQLTLSQAAQATGLPRATVRRSLLTLEHLGYAAAQGRHFRLLPRVLELGYAPLSQLSFEEVVTWHLAELGERVHESASIAVLDGDDIRYVARVPTVRIMSVNITVGTRFPAYATSLGRVLLAGLPPDQRRAALRRITPAPLTPRTLTSGDALRAELDRVRAQGYALVDEELELGLRSLAAPVRDGAGRVIAAVNVSTHASTSTTEEARNALLPPLLTAAAGIEADLHAVAQSG